MHGDHLRLNEAASIALDLYSSTQQLDQYERPGQDEMNKAEIETLPFVSVWTEDEAVMDYSLDHFLNPLPAISSEEVGLQGSCSSSVWSSQSAETSADISTQSSTMSSSGCWSDARRAKHSISCRSKTKLSIAEKLAIVSDFELNRTPQSVLAARFGKSKSAISKILRPDSVARLRSIERMGVEASQSSCARSHNEELERRLHEYVEANQRESQWRLEIRRRAEEVGRELGLLGFHATKGWCDRFIRRHGFEQRGWGPKGPTAT
ncbi:hypothetical protein GUITHDRAFT_110992 [Guillardia theta CCMP2712]|uniref:HTH CENPB-type domain-containing protein n=1 Tax=Guillardia theta (strain CCMP2712) TaxID=905079 RepID=L1J363_GUITC|nr:hypothetical protein GUITHDRAFT_110992 [Guillardia theta CCMP2712]EKX42946.1 hypothetical protein GUITHDRAFT_110992 [Guillardia theta CCMP2712]|eukprot:XP_005829926.1 hypothetical protein GUITHDRAFT_110992 [Guillardia theta CCMP2712]